MSSLGGRSNSYSNRGRGSRGGRGFPPIHQGNRRLINADISGMSLLKELENNPESLRKVQEFLKHNISEEENSSSSFANIVAEQDDNDYYERKSSSQDIIFFLENKDLQWKDEPWHLLQRYLGTASYAVVSYKQRVTFESMLKASNSCDIRHFLPNTQSKIYNFSKIIIKQIISVEEWGLNPLTEKDLIYQNIPVKYNFWDYKNAFYKTFLYQNPQRKHTWFIKVCPQVYNRKIPTWFYNWWNQFGADENILPKQFLDLFHRWKKVSPAIIEAEYDKTYCHNMAILHFFCEFGIPWIWRWEPEVFYTEDNIPCLKRISYIKFWKKMIRNNSEGHMEAQETITQIEDKILEYEERIRSKQQREAFNPFDVFEQRINTHNMSKKEQFEIFMKEAKEAFLKKLGPDGDNNILGNSAMLEDDNTLAMMEDSQDPHDLEDDANMAEFYAKMCPRTNMVSESESSKTLNEEEEDNIEDLGEFQRSSRKKKGKNKKK